MKEKTVKDFLCYLYLLAFVITGLMSLSHQVLGHSFEPSNEGGRTSFTLFLRGAQGKSNHGRVMPAVIKRSKSLLNLLTSHHRGELYFDFLDVDGLLTDWNHGGTRFYDPRQFAAPRLIARALRHRGIDLDIHHIINVLNLKNENPRHVNLKEVELLRQRIYPDRNQFSENPKSHCKEMLKNLNIICYSMGCLTAIKLSHRLKVYPKFRDLKIALFMVDPVGGSIHSRNHQLLTLADNVTEVVGVYALNERSLFFEPIIPKLLNPNSTFTAYTMPGNHLNLVGTPNTKHHWRSKDKIKAKEKPEEVRLFAPIANIVRDLAEKFLFKQGIHLNHRLNYSSDELLGQYEILNANLDFYKQCEKDSFTLLKNIGSGRRARVYRKRQIFLPKLVKALDIKKNDQTGFVNEHHQMIFETLRVR